MAYGAGKRRIPRKWKKERWRGEIRQQVQRRKTVKTEKEERHKLKKRQKKYPSREILLMKS